MCQVKVFFFDVLLKNLDKTGVSEEDLQLIKERLEKEDTILGGHCEAVFAEESDTEQDNEHSQTEAVKVVNVKEVDTMVAPIEDAKTTADGAVVDIPVLPESPNKPTLLHIPISDDLVNAEIGNLVDIASTIMLSESKTCSDNFFDFLDCNATKQTLQLRGLKKGMVVCKLGKTSFVEINALDRVLPVEPYISPMDVICSTKRKGISYFYAI